MMSLQISLTLSKLTTCFFSWGQLKDLPKLGALAIVKNGDNVLTSLGLGFQDYPTLMMKLVYLSGIYLTISWIGLTFFGASFVNTINK